MKSKYYILTQIAIPFITDYFRLFNNFDKDQNGFIDVSELERVLQYFGFNPTKKELEDYMNDLDKNSTYLTNTVFYMYTFEHALSQNFQEKNRFKYILELFIAFVTSIKFKCIFVRSFKLMHQNRIHLKRVFIPANYITLLSKILNLLFKLKM